MSSVFGITLKVNTALGAIPGLGEIYIHEIIGHLVTAFEYGSVYERRVVFDLYEGEVLTPGDEGLTKAEKDEVGNLEFWRLSYESWMQENVVATVPCTNVDYVRYIAYLCEHLNFREDWSQDIASLRKNELIKAIDHRQPLGWFNSASHIESPVFSDPRVDLALQLCRVAEGYGLKYSEQALVDPEMVKIMRSKLMKVKPIAIA